jgi:hypothetical protein
MGGLDPALAHYMVKNALIGKSGDEHCVRGPKRSLLHRIRVYFA